jgi:hypothetical protein
MTRPRALTIAPSPAHISNRPQAPLALFVNPANDHPRMNSSTSLGALGRLPIELVADIVQLVDLEQDLPFIALSSKALLALCAPRLDFEEIRVFTIDEASLWTHLAGSASDARRVRLLHIGASPKDTRFPVRLAGEQGSPETAFELMEMATGAHMTEFQLDRLTRLLSLALEQMGRLRTFRWSRTMIARQLDAQVIWRAIQTHCPLEELLVQGDVHQDVAPRNITTEVSRTCKHYCHLQGLIIVCQLTALPSFRTEQVYDAHSRGGAS